ncbi:hypothetical protein ACHBTE_20425 [Streptomyces sp. M41]|uniref:hypothetical protein n=1 Tax=Streptomyces sp. M41 TaxID=3059412 RepID=UPI00374D3827
MKKLKAAAIVAGSLAVAGVAGPAAALDMPARGLADKGKTVAGSLPSAATLPTGLGTNVKRTADGVKKGVNRSGMVKTPVFGGTLPNPVDGRLLGGLPLNK